MEHFYKDIQGWLSFRELYTYIVKEAPSPAHFVEVGCWKGRSAAYMAVEIINSGKDIRLDCVDTWEGSQSSPAQMADPSMQRGTLYEEFIENTKPVSHIVTPIRLPSVEAAKRYEDTSLDFVFIDGDHLFEPVLADITAWWPKVKVGGRIAGDDYGEQKRNNVSGAVHAFFGDREYEDYLFPYFNPLRNGRHWWVYK